MKTIKLFLSVALVAFTVLSFGNDKGSVNVELGNELIMENWMIEPFAYVENDLVIENWMSLPFGMISLENSLAMENWMISPFNVGMETEALIIECWMSMPFEEDLLDCDGFLMAAACN